MHKRESSKKTHTLGNFFAQSGILSGINGLAVTDGIDSKPMELDQLVRLWMAHTGLSGKQIASRGGVNAGKLSEIRNGKQRNPTWDTLRRIAAGLDVTVQEFFAGPPTASARSKVSPSERVGSPTSPELHTATGTQSGPIPARPMLPADAHVGRSVQSAFTPPPAMDVYQVLDALKQATAALNHATTRLLLADAREQAADPRTPAAERRKSDRGRRRRDAK